MTSVFNRRAALNFAGAGSAAALLSACAPIRTVVKHQEAESSSASSSASAGPASSSSSAASNSPSSSSSVDHKGEVKLESYDIIVEQDSVLQTGVVWFEDPKYVITREPSSSNKSGKYYLWPATITVAVGTYLVAAGQVRDMPANERKTSSKVVMRGEYTGGVWELAGIQALSSTVKP